MVNKNIALYTFEELSQKVKNKLIEKNRYIITELGDWYDLIFNNFIKKAKSYGLDVEYKKIQFVGFDAPGDGACFICDTINTVTLVDKCDFKFKKNLKELFCDRVSFTIKTEHARYYNPYNVYVIYDFDDFGLDAKTKKYLDEMAEHVRYKLDTIKDSLSNELYSELEEEYAILTSDATVAETLIAQEDLYFKNGIKYSADL